jgi:hypothetical protein
MLVLLIIVAVALSRTYSNSPIIAHKPLVNINLWTSHIVIWDTENDPGDAPNPLLGHEITINSWYCTNLDIIAVSLKAPMLKKCNRWHKHAALYLLCILISHANDVQTNPGPTHQSTVYLCGSCEKPVTWDCKAVACDTCSTWYHINCQSIQDSTYEHLGSTSVSWHCEKCNQPNYSRVVFNSDLTTTDPNPYQPLSQDSTESLPSLTRSPSLGIGKPLHQSTPPNKTRTKRNKSKTKPLRILNVNCQNVKAKNPQFLNLLHSTEPDIVLGTESWLKPDIQTSECFPPHFTVYRKDRATHAGGVFIAVNSDIISSELKEIEPEAEEIWVKVNIVGSRDLYLCSHYRPNITYKTSIPNFSKSLHKIGNHNAHVFIGGDFNLPDWDWESNKLKPKAKESTQHTAFIELLHDFGLTQLVLKPTRINNTLDLMITNNQSRVNRTEILPGISDHDTILCELDISPSKVNQPKRDIPQYNRANWDSLRTSIINLSEDINSKASTSSVEDLWNLFSKGLEKSIQEHVPHKTCTNKYHLPWLSPEIKHLIQKRNRTYRAMKKSNDNHLRQNFNILKSKIQRKLRNAYWQYVENIVVEPDQKQTTSKKFYTYLKHNKTDRSGIAPLRDQGRLHTDPIDKANILNQQFQSVFTKENPLPLSALSKDKLPSPYPTMPEIQVTENGILKLLQNLNPYKAAGPDNIKPIILKTLAPEIAPILTTIFIKSLESGVVPSDWRNANVSPIFKKGSRYDPSNYRPISLTCIACKLLEHIIVTAITKHSHLNNILHPNQHGFRQKKSCETQLLEFAHEAANTLKEGKQMDVLVMDFSKAFDKVGHERLCHKLALHGVRGRTLSWIRAFLTGRTQEVVVEGKHSDRAEVISGVPQGSVLGPCLFLHYINDLPEGLGSGVRLFADDTIVYLTLTTINDARKLQSDLDRLASWENKWQMEFHPKKCQVLSITNKKKPIIFYYSLHGHTLERVLEAKYLGITIKKNLNWNQHISNTCNKANRALGFLRRNLKINSIKVKQQAYFTYVRPILEYCSSVWDPFRSGQQAQLEMIQRRAARFACNRYRRTSSVTSMLAVLRWTSLLERRTVARLAMFYKMQNGLVSTHPSQFLSPYLEPNCYKYHIPHSRIDAHAFSFFPRTARAWNRLPLTTVLAPSFEAYKARMTKT